jgi:hypothetical protein
MPPPDPPELAWTVDQACAYFEASGVPIDPVRATAVLKLTAIIRALEIRPVGRAPSGPQGGVGRALYSVRQLQALHRDLAEWLVRDQPAGPGTPS